MCKYNIFRAYLKPVVYILTAKDVRVNNGVDTVKKTEKLCRILGVEGWIFLRLEKEFQITKLNKILIIGPCQWN